VPIAADIVDERDIDAIEPEALQGVLERPHGRVIGIVELGVERHWRPEIRDVVPPHAGAEQAPNLG
jgi:hypothetical protein